MLQKLPYLSQLFSKLLKEFLPAIIASSVGALLLSHYGRTPTTTEPAAIANPASLVTMPMSRDEDARIVVYVKRDTETPRSADTAADQQAERIKAARQATTLTARKARSAETASGADRSAKKISSRQSSEKPDRAAVVGEPLQLFDNANVVAQTVPVATAAKIAAPVARSDDSLFMTKWRETTATVERIPVLLRSMAQRLSSNIPSLSLPQPRPLQML
jgi:hypothetical protein